MFLAIVVGLVALAAGFGVNKYLAPKVAKVEAEVKKDVAKVEDVVTAVKAQV